MQCSSRTPKGRFTGTCVPKSTKGEKKHRKKISWKKEPGLIEAGGQKKKTFRTQLTKDGKKKNGNGK